MSVNVCGCGRNNVKILLSLIFLSCSSTIFLVSELILGTLIYLCSYGNSMEPCESLKNCMTYPGCL